MTSLIDKKRLEISEHDILELWYAYHLINEVRVKHGDRMEDSFIHVASTKSLDVIYTRLLRPLMQTEYTQNTEQHEIQTPETSSDDINRCRILYDKGYNYDVIATHLAEWRNIKLESAVRMLKRYDMPPRRAKRKMRRT